MLFTLPTQALRNAAIGLLMSGLLLGLLTGCSEAGPTAKLDNYLERLGRTLGSETNSIAPISPIKPPKTSALRLPLESAKLGTLDFLELSGCAVQITIGKRNSSLGIFASDSQRLLLELEYLRLAPECIRYKRSQGEQQLAETLAQAQRLKRAQLPALIFNATLASGEYRQMWRKPKQLADYPAQTSSLVLTSLAAINTSTQRWLAGDYQADNREFEIHLSEIAKGDSGALWLALALQHAKLTEANQLIDSRLQRGPLCPPGRKPEAAAILRTVVHKYFIGEVQPWSAALGRRKHQLLPPTIELEGLLEPALSAPYRQWQQARDTALRELSQAPKNHVQQLQLILASCTE